MDPAWIALIGTLFGGVGLKLVEYWLSQGTVKVTEDKNIRDELRLTATAQKAEIDQLENDVDKWREEYFNLKEKYLVLQTELTLALARIKDE